MNDFQRKNASLKYLNLKEIKRISCPYSAIFLPLLLGVTALLIQGNRVVSAASDIVKLTNTTAEILPLRTTAEQSLLPEVAQSVLKEKGLFDSRRNPSGKGFPHDYEIQKGGKVVHDHACNVMWQLSGSQKEMNYVEANHYVSQLNSDQYASYNDWRLPTIEEAMSLMEPKKNRKELHINPVFDPQQGKIWTSDMRKARMAWIVRFDMGYCDYMYTDTNIKYYVRAVR